MDNKKNATAVATASAQETTNRVGTIVSSIEGLPHASAGEAVQEPVRLDLAFDYADVTSDKEGKSWIRVFVKGLNVPLFRNTKQASSDLSDYIDRATSAHLSLTGFKASYNEYFKGKKISATISSYDEGAQYVADENSSEVKEGRAQIGDTLSAKGAGVRIEGFLLAKLTDEENRAILEREIAYAKEMASKVTSGRETVVF